MFRSYLFAALGVAGCILTTGGEIRAQEASGWHSAPATNAAATAQPISSAAQSPVTPNGDEGIIHAQVTNGTGALPTEDGQVWREYDITPYTMRSPAGGHPEQAIVDWILRETGYEAWHSTPVALLSADRKTLRAYHTPQMQNTVADIVDRFVSTKAQTHGFGLRILTLKNPNWRTRALGLMTPIPVQSPGVQGWIMAKENAAMLMAELRKRSDYRETNSPHQMVFNGQALVISNMRPRPYTKGIIPTGAAWPGYQLEQGQIEEGYVLEFSPLLSTDARTTDAVVKLRLSQVERMIQVGLDTPSAMAQNQRVEVEVPQLTAIQVHERFRWPTDSVLLLSMGVVAAPGPEAPNFLTGALPLPKSAPRADALLMIESTGAVSQTTPTPGAAGMATPQTATAPSQTFHGRY